MAEGRQYFRLRRQIEIDWSIPEKEVEGSGVIFNISVSGILFETDKLFPPEHGLKMSFVSQEVPLLPAKGKLMWFKKIGEKKDHYMCGVHFLKDPTTWPAWVEWMEDNISKLADTSNSVILGHYLS